MNTIKLSITDAPDLIFKGELVGEAKSNDNPALSGIYSGRAGCWTLLKLYQTAGGKFVCWRGEISCWAGVDSAFTGKVCTTEAEVIEFFSYDDLSKALYADADIASEKEID